jgi:hypothetical protein
MTPLPLDVARCHPIHADVWCKQCRRYADHPEQTWRLGCVVAAFSCHGSGSEDCRYIPINSEK